MATALQEAPIRVFVHLAYGFGARAWQEKWDKDEIIGINERLPYGYVRAEDYGCAVEYSEARQETWIGKLIRLCIRVILGFDFVHAWYNRRGIYDADVVWTHTESQHLAVLALLLLKSSRRRPKIIAQSVWLIDRWAKFSAPRRWLYARLLSKADLLTFHSPENLKVARELFPHVRSELVLFGIRTEHKVPPQRRPAGRPIRVISVGNDEDRDWAALIDAVRTWNGCELRIVSGRISPALVRGAHNVSIVRPRATSELLKLYEWADLLVLSITPNLHASGITVLQEAALLGLPAICSDTGGLKAYFSEDEVRYVPVQDPQAIRHAIQELAEDETGRWAMARRAQARMGPRALSSHSFARRHAELSMELRFGSRTADLDTWKLRYFSSEDGEPARKTCEGASERHIADSPF